MIQTGSIVRVYPHGSPEDAVTGTVENISSNQRSIAVMFEDRPPFVTVRAGFFTGPGGVVMLATRESVGPWVEMNSGGHYEIEEI